MHCYGILFQVFEIIQRIFVFIFRGTLYDVLKDETNNVDWSRVLFLAIGAIKGINCLHNWKPQILHRDLKSLNLVVFC